MLFYICFSNVKNTKQIIIIYTILQKLSRDCNDVIRNIIKDSAHNYMEDPVLASTCEREVHIHVYSSSMVLNLLSFIFETCHDHFVVFLDYLKLMSKLLLVTLPVTYTIYRYLFNAQP